MHAAGAFPEDETVLDPDDLKMPESPQHRAATDLVALATMAILGDQVAVYRDMNWYPPDGQPAMAPGIMVLPAGTLAEGAKSYRQGESGDPSPLVAVEIPSNADTYHGLFTKLGRYARLGVPSYVIDAEPPSISVLHHNPDTGVVVWGSQPIPELGGLWVDTAAESLVVVHPDGRRLTSDHQWLTDLDRELTEQAQRTEALDRELTEQAQRTEAEAARADALAEQLRSLGVQPDR